MARIMLYPQSRGVMKKVFEIALGIVTSVGGFLDVGSIATSSEAGARFGFALIWPLALGTICVIFLVEMSGRLAAVSKHTLAAAIRERFGFGFHFAEYCVEMVVDFLTLSAEIGGVCIALQLATGISYRWWALPVAFGVWLLLFKGTFGLIENGVTLLGLVTLSFVVGMFLVHPPLGEVARGLLPGLPRQDVAQYLFIAVSILGATIAPYLLFFYSSGAIEDKWDESYMGVNRAVAALGMGFGSLIALGVMVVSGAVLFPKGIRVDSYDQIAQGLAQPLGSWGFPLFAASLFIACTGAALEVGLGQAYVTAQAFGWNWGESQRPRREARFTLAYTLPVFLAPLLMVAGVDPLALTLFTMALVGLVLPLVIGPLLILMNDEHYVGKYRNGPITNGTVLLV